VATSGLQPPIPRKAESRREMSHVVVDTTPDTAHLARRRGQGSGTSILGRGGDMVIKDTWVTRPSVGGAISTATTLNQRNATDLVS
jgi:hypothetical protein